jgi:hypothetical protein
VDVTADELEVFAMLLLSLNRKKYPLKLLILDNCDLTDEKLVNPALDKTGKSGAEHNWQIQRLIKLVNLELNKTGKSGAR